LFLSNALYKSKPLQYLNSLNEEKHGFHSIAVSEQQFRYIVGFKDDEVIVAFKGSKDVKDFLKTKVVILELDTPLLEAIKTVIKEEIVLVQKKDKSLSGIVRLLT